MADLEARDPDAMPCGHPWETGLLDHPECWLRYDSQLRELLQDFAGRMALLTLVVNEAAKRMRLAVVPLTPRRRHPRRS